MSRVRDGLRPPGIRVPRPGRRSSRFDGKTCILERGLVADRCAVKASKADDSGNLVFLDV